MSRITVTSLLLMLSTNFGTDSFPIHNGLCVKFNRIFAKGRAETKSFGALFEKNPQQLTPVAELRKHVLSKKYSPEKDSGTRYHTNQHTRITLPAKYSGEYNCTTTIWDNKNFINIPIIQQPYSDYNILVATAPPHMHIGPDGKPMVIYIVFSEDITMDESGSFKVPNIYFVNEHDVKLDRNKYDKFDPVIIIDNNRTVTGLHSRQISKFVNFKNKLIDRYNYQVTPWR